MVADSVNVFLKVVADFHPFAPLPGSRSWQHNHTTPPFPCCNLMIVGVLLVEPPTLSSDGSQS